MPYSTSITAIISAARMLFRNRRSFLLILAVYSALLAAIYLFVSTREATVSQLLVTLITIIAAPALFFVLQAATIGYASGPTLRGLLKNSLKLILVTVPLIALTLLAVYGINKLQTHLTIVTTVRYLLLAVVVPLFVIHFWIAAIDGGLRTLVKRLRKVLTRTFAPQSMFVYACGFLVFAVAPYFLLQKAIPSQHPWIEVALIVGRLSVSALLILLGWVTTVGAISILSHAGYPVADKE